MQNQKPEEQWQEKGECIGPPAFNVSDQREHYSKAKHNEKSIDGVGKKVWIPLVVGKESGRKPIANLPVCGP